MTKAAVLGAPIEHSLSPIIHESAYRLLGWNWSYSKFEVASGDLKLFLSQHQGEFRALSLTMPLKEEALPLIDSSTELVRITNAANTIIFDDLGSHGHNTDVAGFRDALAFHKVNIPETVVILGGGATARSAIAAVDGRAKVIDVYSRSAHRGKSLVNSAQSSIVNVKPWQTLHDSDQLLTMDLVISTTPIGTTDDLKLGSMREGALFESLYHPWPTLFLDRWRQCGGFGIDGLDLLVWQAIGQLELMAFDQDEVVERKQELYTQMRIDALQVIQSR
jgi:shikimate dehydrogenase